MFRLLPPRIRQSHLLAAVLLAAAPAWAQTRIAPSDLTGAETAFSLSASGDRAVIGVPDADGSRGVVYVADRTDTVAPWRIGVLLARNGAEVGDRFGADVALAGSDLFVSVPGYETPLPDGSTAQVGAVVHFRWNPGVSAWAQQSTITPDDLSRRFGTEIVYGGDGALAIRSTDDEVHVFEQVDAVTWTRATTFPSPRSNSQFGSALAMDGTTLVVGAPGFGGDGTAFIYDRDAATGTWAETARLSRGGVATSGRGSGSTSTFGAAVAIDGDLIAVGAPTDVNTGLSSFTGGVVTFELDATDGWRRVETLYPSAGVNNGRFGESVAVDGLRVTAGAPAEGDGALYVFDRAAGGSRLAWTETARRTQPSGPAGRFGEAVALADRLPLALAPSDRSAFAFDALAVNTAEAPDADLRVSAPAPNPTPATATLRLTVDVPQHVRAAVVDALGREVAVVHEGPTAGELTLRVEGGALAPGAYVVRVVGERFAATRTFTVVR